MNSNEPIRMHRYVKILASQWLLCAVLMSTLFGSHIATCYAAQADTAEAETSEQQQEAAPTDTETDAESKKKESDEKPEAPAEESPVAKESEKSKESADTAGESKEDKDAKKSDGEESKTDAEKKTEPKAEESKSDDAKAKPAEDDAAKDNVKKDNTAKPTEEVESTVEPERTMEVEEKPAPTPPPKPKETEKPPKSSKEDKCIIGSTATLLEKQSGLKFRARIDTGAKSCSLHVEKVEIENESTKEDIVERMTENIGKVATFVVKNGDGKTHILKRKIATYVIIKTSNKAGGKRRYKVPLTFLWKNMEKEVLVTLNDRQHMEYPLLIGRNFLRDDFLVDVSLNSDD